MELVAHGGTIFYSVHTHRQAHALIHACTQKQAGTKQLPPPSTLAHMLTYTHTHSHAPTRGKGALLFDAAHRALAGFCFTPFVYLF